MGGGGGVSFGGGGGSNGQVSSDKENHTPGGGGGGSDSDSDDGPILYRGPGDVVMLPQMDDEELEEEGKRGECRILDQGGHKCHPGHGAHSPFKYPSIFRVV